MTIDAQKWQFLKAFLDKQIESNNNNIVISFAEFIHEIDRIFDATPGITEKEYEKDYLN